MDAAEIIYVGRDNTVELQLVEDGVPQSLAPVTRMVLTFGALTVDSQGTPSAFDWQTDPTRVVLKLGQVEGLADNLGRHGARLTVYAPDHPNGLVWTEALSLQVKV